MKTQTYNNSNICMFLTSNKKKNKFAQKQVPFFSKRALIWKITKVNDEVRIARIIFVSWFLRLFY